jgi:hypothetical protein
MNILKHMNDFDKIQDGTKMLQLTNVSDGTLLSCIRESGIFGGKTVISPSYMDKIRNAWRLFTQSTIQKDYNSWVDNWKAFLVYASSSSVEFKSDFLVVSGVEHCSRFDENSRFPEDLPYDLYFTPFGRVRIYDDGQITLGINHLGHTTTAFLDGMTAFCNQASNQKGF